MNHPISEQAIDQLFVKARTHHAWLKEPVSDELLKKLYEVAKWGPTSVNSNPARLVFVKSQEGREKLLPALMGSNADQVKAAPVTVIIAQDMKFYDQLPTLAPHADTRSWFVGNQPLIESTAFRNSSLQGAYLILAARALGLDVCPMSGFDNIKVDEAFFKGTSLKSNFIMTLGYGDASKLHPRAARLGFEEAAQII